MRSALVFSALAIAGCQPTVNLDWTAPADTKSFVLALEDPGCAGRSECTGARAYAGNELKEPVFLPQGSYRIYLLAFPFGLEELELVEGVLPSCGDANPTPACQPGEPLPSGSINFMAELEGSEAGAFLPVLETSEAIRAILLPRTPAEDCANQGGCFLSDERICTECPRFEGPVAPAWPEDVRLFDDFSFPCRERWTEVDGICVPPVEQASKPSGACARGTAQRRDRADCEPIGADCPIGQDRFSPLTPPGAIYVDGSATAGGTGESPDSPLRTIGEALPSGRPITVAIGTYAECFTTGARVLGACATQTRIDAASCGGLELTGGSARLENIAVDGQIRVRAGSVAALEGVDADNTTRSDCIRSDDADLTVRSTIARNCLGAGLLAGGGKIRLDDFLTEDAFSGVQVENARLDAQHLVVRGGTLGFQALDGVNATIADLLVEGTTFNAINVDGADISGDDILVRDTRFDRENPGRALSLGATGGADSEIALGGVVVERVASAGIAVVASEGRTSTVTLSDVFLRDLQGAVPGWDSYAFSMDGAVTASVSRMAIIGVEDVALDLRRGASAELDRLVIRPDRLRHNRAIQLLGADAKVKNAKLSGTAVIGALVERGSLSLENVRIDELAIGALGGNGQAAAIKVAAEAELFAKQVTIDEVRGAGLIAESPATLEDVAFANIRSPSNVITGLDGVAITAQADVFGDHVSILTSEQALVVSRGRTRLENAFFQNVGRIESYPSIIVTDAELTMIRSHTRSPDKVLSARDSKLVFEDVNFAGPSVGPNDQAMFVNGGTIELDRFELDGRTAHGDGMALCGTTTERANDVKIWAYEQGVGAIFGSAEVKSLTRFLFDGNFIGMTVSDLCAGAKLRTVELNASDGLVLAQEAGLRVLSETWDPANAMLRVRYVADSAVQMARGQLR